MNYIAADEPDAIAECDRGVHPGSAAGAVMAAEKPVIRPRPLRLGYPC